jgi:hypothetical protein
MAVTEIMMGLGRGFHLLLLFHGHNMVMQCEFEHTVA